MQLGKLKSSAECIRRSRGRLMTRRERCQERKTLATREVFKSSVTKNDSKPEPDTKQIRKRAQIYSSEGDCLGKELPREAVDWAALEAGLSQTEVEGSLW